MNREVQLLLVRVRARRQAAKTWATRLAKEARPPRLVVRHLLRKQLECDLAVQVRVEGPLHDAHAAPAQLDEQLKLQQALAHDLLCLRGRCGMHGVLRVSQSAPAVALHTGADLPPPPDSNTHPDPV